MTELPSKAAYDGSAASVDAPQEARLLAADQERALVENLAPGHYTPGEFYEMCAAKAARTGQTAYGVAFFYALGVIDG